MFHAILKELGRRGERLCGLNAAIVKSLLTFKSFSIDNTYIIPAKMGHTPSESLNMFTKMRLSLSQSLNVSCDTQGVMKERSVSSWIERYYKSFST